MRQRLVVSVVLEEASDELDRRLAELVCSPGVAAWQVDRRRADEGEGLGHAPGEVLVDAVRELEAVTA